MPKLNSTERDAFLAEPGFMMDIATVDVSLRVSGDFSFATQI